MIMSEAATTVWFVTGCSTGIGRELAKEVLRRGHACVVTARDRSRIDELVLSYSTTGLALPLDVSKPAEIERAVSTAESRFGRIDVLVNNAGYGYLAAVEEGEDEEVRAMFETNFFGLAALVRRVLPGMRKRRRGHIVNISSVGGLVGNASAGYYNATKFAVEGLSQALRKEVAPLGLHVTLIEPGPFRTDWAGRSLRTVRHPIAAYASIAGARRLEVQQNNGKQPGDPVRAAKAIIQVTEAPNPPLHLVLGRLGLERVRAELDDVKRSMDEWEPVSVACDFPAAAPAASRGAR
jgi:NAD(P)-dependent dehydrogenase (short-subunit alcohol dehydrogenase family)